MIVPPFTKRDITRCGTLLEQQLASSRHRMSAACDRADSRSASPHGTAGQSLSQSNRIFNQDTYIYRYPGAGFRLQITCA